MVHSSPFKLWLLKSERRTCDVLLRPKSACSSLIKVDLPLRLRPISTNDPFGLWHIKLVAVAFSKSLNVSWSLLAQVIKVLNTGWSASYPKASSLGSPGVITPPVSSSTFRNFLCAEITNGACTSLMSIAISCVPRESNSSRMHIPSGLSVRRPDSISQYNVSVTLISLLLISSTSSVTPILSVSIDACILLAGAMLYRCIYLSLTSLSASTSLSMWALPPSLGA